MGPMPANHPSDARVFRGVLESVLPVHLRGPAAPVIGKMLALNHLDAAYDRVAATADSGGFFSRALDVLAVHVALSPGDLDRVPRQGPVIVVANHPFGMIEGLVLGSILERVRSDVRILANHLLGAMPLANGRLILVDPFGRPDSARRNSSGLRSAVEWLRGGGMLGVFPAGEVSHFDFSRGGISDPEWSDTVVRLATHVNVPILPVRFDGANGPAFQILGLLHPSLRTLMLTNELWNKRGRTITMRIGQAVDPARLGLFRTERSATAYLRNRTYALAGPPASAGAPAVVRTQLEPLARPEPVDALRQEMSSAAITTLVKTGEMRVLLARAGQIPHALREIGRLRELTFRQAGEGTGKASDLDRFDEHYLHLVLWSDKDSQVAGAYRLAPSMEVLPRLGVRGFYTSTLFAWKRGFVDRLGPAIELGRSFIRPEYQKSFSALLLLWKGIGQYLVANPQYRILFGPVSISNDYHPDSRQLMVRFLKSYCLDATLSNLVRARNPFRLKPRRDVDDIIDGTAHWDIDSLSAVIADFETGQKGVPVLLRQYLKLGGRLVAFNVDSNFSDALDGLIVVDLTRTERRTLERYMGVAGAAQF